MARIKSHTRGVEIVRGAAGGRLVQEMACALCPETVQINTSTTGLPLPQEVLFKQARNKGWHPHKNGQHVCPKCKEKAMATRAEDAPREMQPTDKRKIWRRLDECYDDNHERYCDGYTDQVIATELGMPRKWVTDVREADFGPSGENVEMERVASALGKISSDLNAAIDDCLKAAELAEKLKEEVEANRMALDRIKKAVGPHRAA